MLEDRQKTVNKTPVVKNSDKLEIQVGMLFTEGPEMHSHAESQVVGMINGCRTGHRLRAVAGKTVTQLKHQALNVIHGSIHVGVQQMIGTRAVCSLHPLLGIDVEINFGGMRDV